MSNPPVSPQGSTLVCSSCGHANPAWLTDCKNCGTKLQLRSASPAANVAASHSVRNRQPFHTPERPGCVTVYAVLVGISGTLGILGGLGFGVFSLGDSRTNVGVGLFTTILIFGAGGFQLLLAKGLWDLKNWARILVIIGNSLALIGPILTLIYLMLTPNTLGRAETMPALIGGLVELAIAGYFVYWFSDNANYFR